MKDTLELHIRRVETEDDWVAAQHIRTRVFIEEQACPPEEEWDAYDTPQARGSTAHHLLGETHGQLVATARWHATVVEGEPAAKLERFAVLPEARGYGLGRVLIAHTLADARAAGFSHFVLHAQAHLDALYASFGFERLGEVFDEAGIPHVKMLLIDP